MRTRNSRHWTIHWSTKSTHEYAKGVLDGIEYWLEARFSKSARIESVLIRDGW